MCCVEPAMPTGVHVCFDGSEMEKKRQIEKKTRIMFLRQNHCYRNWHPTRNKWFLDRFYILVFFLSLSLAPVFFLLLLLFRFPLKTDVLNFLYHHFLLLSRMWLEKYLSTILAIITEVQRIVGAMPSLSFPSFFFFFFWKRKNFDSCSCVQTRGPRWRQTEILVSYAEWVAYQWACCLAVVLCCVYADMVRTRKENVFDSRTSLKSCRRPIERRTFTEMQCPIKRDWISVAAVAIFLRVGWR